MFTDHVKITISSGNGGAGAVAFRREKFVVKGGPEGGDGGRGGDVYFEVDNNSHTLSSFKGLRHIKAQNGRPGEARNRYGKYGEKLIIKVPPGTQVIDDETEEILLDLTQSGRLVKFLEGGKGGLGNSHFKSSTNQRPTYAQPGLSGITKSVRLDLKLIADVGLVGFPNVGKSTLISVLSNARPEIADYEFTTITPKLGQVNIGDYDSFVMADIPGIIEGASDGKGLGLKFLRHIERTNTLLFMVDLANYRESSIQFSALREELSNFSNSLKEANYAIALTRLDALSEDEVTVKSRDFIKGLGLNQSVKSEFGFSKELPFYEQIKDEFNRSRPFFVAPISSVMQKNTDALKYALMNLVEMGR